MLPALPALLPWPTQPTYTLPEAAGLLRVSLRRLRDWLIRYAAELSEPRYRRLGSTSRLHRMLTARDIAILESHCLHTRRELDLRRLRRLSRYA